jgi:uncharacterized repeat protein (TIGR03803 family)
MILNFGVSHRRIMMLGLVLLTRLGVAMGASESVILSFANFPRGANPYSSLARDSAGNLYGTASEGGLANAGIIYRLDPAGNQTVLHNFTGEPDGANPYAGVIRSTSGTIYGTTTQGGVSNLGTVFRLDMAGQLTVLHSFEGGIDGETPYAGLTSDAAGNLYGTCNKGGTGNAGIVYKLSPNGIETILYSFTGGIDGANPYAGVILDPAGNLYGTTYTGGAQKGGVIYKIIPSGQEVIIHTFSGSGIGPYAGVIRDSAGNLYGATAGSAEIYKVDAAGNYTALYDFRESEGSPKPEGDLVRDAVGNLYGTTQSNPLGGLGQVYKLTTGGKLIVMYQFPGATTNLAPNGPNAGPILDSQGNLYGATPTGGVAGMIYKINSSAQITALYDFQGAPGGTDPNTGVILTWSGEFYGATANGGAANAGTVYKVTSTGRETVLYTFAGGVDGSHPGAGVVIDSAGNVYGTTELGGAANQGVIYRVDAGGHESVLYSFSGGADGGEPLAGVIRDSSGNIYGTTFLGGTSNAGVVYRLDSTGQQTVLHSFSGGIDGGHPDAGVVRDNAGNLYGTAYSGGAAGLGVIFRVSSDGAETVLHSFAGGPDGALPYAGLLRDIAGNLYGTTSAGGGPVGEGGAGLVYKLSTAGLYTVLYTFSGSADGGAPLAGITRDKAGNLYGTTSVGGLVNCLSGCGVIFKLDQGGHETVLYSFSGGADGSNPASRVILDSNGNLYGTTPTGGKAGAGMPPSGAGVIYRLALSN